MSTLLWDSPEKLRALLGELVSWKSMTLTEDERQFPMKLQSKLQQLTYFQHNPNHLALHAADLRRKFMTALYKHPEAVRTICLISHFDTVSTEEYGELEPLATQPEELTAYWMERPNDLPEDVVADLQSGEYLFGRGTMDMKMGLALHMQLLEKASTEKWPINLLLLTVPDEEVNSAGMRAAVPKLLELQTEFGLTYSMFLNSEPVFTLKPGDDTRKMYSGTIGKMMPGALFYGRETHAGEPFNGLTSPYIASFLTRKMEWNPLFQETVLGETTPLPVTLQQKDLRLEYSTQTPYRSSALYNVFTMEQTPEDIMETFEQTAKIAAEECNKAYQAVCRANRVRAVGKVRVLRYEELLRHSVQKFGESFIEEVKAEVYANEEWDDREKSFRLADKFIIQSQELAPAIILLFAPPFYPAVNSSGHEAVEQAVRFFQHTAEQEYGMAMERVHYFNGICDLSYVNGSGKGEGWQAFERNTPVWKDVYTVPFAEMARLQAPVLNIGPFGKDAHKRTERLHIKHAFEQLPAMLEKWLKEMKP
ncbi:M20/M25/M40 family metallo-hydrolase [Domibacillus enclensis]|uniref:Amino acid degradation protein n=1 Tax=Domibacillus enclensis TaxID=1017273 RepID=A0A1N7BEM7_9BACI|nr:M20/M25/M40 family metallo-hydrolase [Domibacillus enclensis]OXS74757.1 amino acid degradation protein [Domibacillus enclensis]SIR49798.1 Arginine utilization protein RocB [Domibacillus enclensis]